MSRINTLLTILLLCLVSCENIQKNKSDEGIYFNGKYIAKLKKNVPYIYNFSGDNVKQAFICKQIDSDLFRLQMAKVIKNNYSDIDRPFVKIMANDIQFDSIKFELKGILNKRKFVLSKNEIISNVNVKKYIFSLEEEIKILVSNEICHDYFHYSIMPSHSGIFILYLQDGNKITGQFDSVPGFSKNLSFVIYAKLMQLNPDYVPVNLE